jgi:hypothetical protein
MRVRCGTMRRYLETTRTRSHSLLLALPLLLVYEAGAALLAGRHGLRTGADVLLRTLLAAEGVRGTALLTALLVAAGGALVVHERRRRRVPLRAGHFAAMLAESAAYAMAFAAVMTVAARAVQQVWQPGAAGLAGLRVADAVVLAMGAGIYEALLFRVVVTGGLLALLLALGLRRGWAAAVAVLASALCFSAFHLVGPYAEALEAGSFALRFLAGAVLAAVYVARGLGIAAWTHALSDIFLLLAARG